MSVAHKMAVWLMTTAPADCSDSLWLHIAHTEPSASASRLHSLQLHAVCLSHVLPACAAMQVMDEATVQLALTNNKLAHM